MLPSKDDKVKPVTIGPINMLLSSSANLSPLPKAPIPLLTLKRMAAVNGTAWMLYKTPKVMFKP